MQDRSMFVLFGFLLSLAALLALSANCPTTAANASAALPRQSTTLRVIAFNTHLLPAVALAIAGHRSQGDYRSRAIGRRMTDFDIVGLCEVFDEASREQLIDAVRANSADSFAALWYPKPRGRGLTNSGLLLLSRLPIEEHHLLTYRHASRFLTDGFKAEGLAAKGAIHARLKFGDAAGESMDCFLTHLESRSSAARERQLEELARFIAEHAERNRPAILLGDLNVAADIPNREMAGAADSPYQRMLATLRTADLEFIDVWPTLQLEAGGTSDPLAEDGGRRIDYCFVSAPNGGSASLRPMSVNVERFLDSHLAEGSLSDHAAVECELSLVVRRAPVRSATGGKDVPPRSE
jgi:endonuclease/exonuclease/phosphatase family metal-dependent hydrolase